MKILQILIFVLGFTVFTHAQEIKLTTLTGSVVDQSGTGIEDTMISLIDLKGFKFETFTNEYGAYNINIKSGTYSIKVEYIKHQGWEKFNIEKFEIASREKINLDITLRINEEFIKKYSTPLYSPTTDNKIDKDKENEPANISILTGSIYDANGAVIPATKVMAINARGEKFETLTNDSGVYTLNLPFNLYDTKDVRNFKMANYEVIVESEYFEKFVLKNFKFVPSYKGKMFLDFALNLKGKDNCGAGGCTQSEPRIIESPNLKVTNTITEKPLE